MHASLVSVNKRRIEMPGLPDYSKVARSRFRYSFQFGPTHTQLSGMMRPVVPPLMHQALRSSFKQPYLPGRHGILMKSHRFSSSIRRDSIGKKIWQFRSVRYPVYAVGSIIFTITAAVSGLLLYDSMTYHKVSIQEPVQTMPLDHVRGGPDNRPILPRFVDPETHEELKTQQAKERLVIVGGGWGAVSLLRSLDPDTYDVTVVSPTNYFLFTPLLPAVTVGTVGTSSVVESLRRILQRCHGQFVQGAARNVHTHDKLDANTLQLAENARGLLEVEVISDQWDGDVQAKHEVNEKSLIYVPYDKLVIAVGCVTNDFGAKGLEHAHRLKCMSDAMSLRKHILENFERASLPTTPEEERKRLLSFVICGGGPTGVEVAAEIFDLIHEDIHKYFPSYLPHEANVHLLQHPSHILNTYSEKISEFAEERFRKEKLNVVTNAHVDEITPTSVTYTLTNPLTETQEKCTVPTGCTVWSAGVKMNDFTHLLSTTLPNQGHRHALKVDSQLRVLGTEPGTIYAVGDASTIDRDIRGYVVDNFAKFDKDHDGKLSVAEFGQLIKVLRQRFPIASHQLKNVRQLFIQYDHNRDHVMSSHEVIDLVMDATKHMTSYPPTAQIAAQEGRYLGRKLNVYGKLKAQQKLPDVKPDALDDMIYKPFKFHNLGSIAYLGNAAAFDLPLPEPFKTFFGGIVAMYAWRSVYLSELVSLRTRALVLGDFIKRELWGRDVSWL